MLRNLCDNIESGCPVWVPPEHWVWDGVHPTYSGHQIMADEWIRTVRKFGIVPTINPSVELKQMNKLEFITDKKSSTIRK